MIWSDLPLFLLVLVVQSIYTLLTPEPSTVTLVLLSINGIICAAGLTFLFAFYVHTVKCIFNRRVPLDHRPLLEYFKLIRPLEAIFRLLTARWRVLPDVIVAGEVRCGTTTICQHLSALPGCSPPFCPWKHPELDNKETFYFAGHYLGLVDPRLYSMCFPLKLTRWFHCRVLGKPFFTFDGCAQYLSSPTAPYLIAEAYRLRGLDPPLIIACTRDPVAQAVSWWRYENNAMLWGQSLGLKQWNTRLRSQDYPPKTISDALHFSQSQSVDSAYATAEQLAISAVESRGSTRLLRLPQWSISWPGGQLAGIGRNGLFEANMGRFERAFGRQGIVFPVELERLSDNHALHDVLLTVVEHMSNRSLRQGACPGIPNAFLAEYIATALPLKRNAGMTCADPSIEPTEEQKAELREYFERNQLLSDWRGRMDGVSTPHSAGE